MDSTSSAVLDALVGLHLNAARDAEASRGNAGRDREQLVGRQWRVEAWLPLSMPGIWLIETRPTAKIPR